MVLKVGTYRMTNWKRDKHTKQAIISIKITVYQQHQTTWKQKTRQPELLTARITHKKTHLKNTTVIQFSLSRSVYTADSGINCFTLKLLIKWTIWWKMQKMNTWRAQRYVIFKMHSSRIDQWPALKVTDEYS